MTHRRGAGTARLWRCPRCGAKLIARNLSHACGAYSIQQFLAGKTTIGKQLFRRFVANVHFVLPRTIGSQRFRKVDHLGKLHVHHLRLRDRRDCDLELANWLVASYHEYGRRGWLRDARHVHE